MGLQLNCIASSDGGYPLVLPEELAKLTSTQSDEATANRMQIFMEVSIISLLKTEIFIIVIRMEIERSESESQEKAKKFRIQSKSWFLTYPKLDKSKEEALALLKNKLAGKPYVGMVVCRELHEDGSPHIHAFVLLKDLFNCQNERFWDLDSHHGEYQKARDITAVAKYIKKDGDYIETASLIGRRNSTPRRLTVSTSVSS